MRARRYDTRVRRDAGGARRRIVAWAAALAILMNFAVGGLVTAKPAALDRGSPGLDDAAIVICTAQGKIVVDRDGRPVSRPSGEHEGHEGPHCLFCLPLMHGAVAPAAFDFSPIAQGRESDALPVCVDASRRELFRVAALWARGPPSA